MLLIEHQKMHPDQKRWVKARTFFPIDPPEHNPNWRSEVNALVAEYAAQSPARFTWVAGEQAETVVFEGLAGS